MKSLGEYCKFTGPQISLMKSTGNQLDMKRCLAAGGWTVEVGVWLWRGLCFVTFFVWTVRNPDGGTFANQTAVHHLALS